MKRLSMLSALWLLPAACFGGETLELKGLIYDAHFQAFRSTIISQTDREMVAVLEPFVFDVSSNNPLPYVGTFSYWPDSHYAAFQYTVPYDGSPFTVDFGDLFEAIVHFDDDSLVISRAFSAVGDFVSNFDLALNRSAVQGGWEWTHVCLTCDPVGDIGHVFATITSLRAIPEPSSVAIAVICVWSIAPWRRRRSFRPRHAIKSIICWWPRIGTIQNATFR
jgi:hypothetical protein